MGRFLVLLPILLLLATPIPTVAAAQDDPATVVQRFFDARNRHDIDATLALVTDDVRFVGGPYCTPASPCIGREAFRTQHLQQEFIPGRAQAVIVGAPQVSGATVVVRSEVRSDPIRRAGAERIVVTATIEVRGGQLASYVGVPDASDPQTAQYLAFVQNQPGMPNTGGGATAQPAAGWEVLLLALVPAVLGLAFGALRQRRARRQGA